MLLTYPARKKRPPLNLVGKLSLSAGKSLRKSREEDDRKQGRNRK